MKYRQDAWYIAGLIITGISVAVMAVTMVMMYYGSNKAIVVCFAAMPLLAVGILLSQSVKRRYEEADASSGEPLPMFWRIRYGFHNLKVFILTHDVWHGILIASLAVFLTATVVLGGLCGYWAFARSSVKKEPQYIENTVLYDEHYAEWQQARKSGDEVAQKKHFAVMEDAREIMQKYEARMEDYKGLISSTWPWAAVTAAMSALSGAALYAYRGYKKGKTKK